MECVDLDISNYSLTDILGLFGLSHNFSRDDLRNAKKVVLRTHPDKSKLDKKYFLFFTKAYRMLFEIHEFKTQTNTRSTEYVVEKDEGEAKILEDVKNKENFNEWFNELFEKNRLSTLGDSDGYGDWLKSDEACSSGTANTVSEMNAEIESKKAEMRAVVQHQDVTEFDGGVGYDIVGGTDGFQSGMFSALQYDDLRKAHTETVVPVTDQDYQSTKKFGSVDEMRNHRSRQDTAPLSLEQSKRYLAEKDDAEAEMSAGRAFQLAKEHEANQEKSKQWWSQVKQITQ